MSDRYLWEGTGPPDPEIQLLEQQLASYRYRPGATGPRARDLRLGWLAAAAAVVLVAGVAWMLVRGPAPAAVWEVTSIAGGTTIDAAVFGSRGHLGVGQWLETNPRSRAQVRVADIGNVTVHPNTRLRLLESRARREHRLELARGRIEAIITAPPRLFFVNTPAAVAVDLGCAYELEVAEDGRGYLEVTFGLVSFERDGRVSTVPAEAACRTRPAVGPGTPFFIDATPALQRSLETLDFGGGGTEALRTVLAEARQRDTLTLWHLLTRVDAAQVASVYDRLAELSPPPSGVDRQNILRRRRGDLEAWWNDLGRLW